MPNNLINFYFVFDSCRFGIVLFACCISVGGSVYVVGRGFSINLPVSSQDILKSFSTDLVRDVRICGAITSLCMPMMNSATAREYKIG